MSVPALEVRDLSYSYPDGTSVLDAVDFHVHPGERVARPALDPRLVLRMPRQPGETRELLHGLRQSHA